MINQDLMNKLDEITNRCIKTRIINELKKIADDTISISVEIYESDNHKLPVIKIEDKLYKTYNSCSFIIHENYPFHKPTIQINCIPYINTLKISSVKTMNLLKSIKNIDCFCCNSSVTCENSWKPSITIYDVITEIRKFKQFRRDIINKIFADKIKQKYLIKDIKIDEWLFS